MSFKRSKSCIFKTNQKNNSTDTNVTLTRKLSLIQLKNKNREEEAAKLFKQKIQSYIAKRSDVEIIIHYQQYKEQFFRKSKNVQDYLYANPEIKQKYLSEQNSHFLRGFQQIMLNLFRKKIIVPGSYNNMRQEAIFEIEKWVLSWIQRQILYQNMVQEQNQAIKDANLLLQQITKLGKQCLSEELTF